MVVQKIKRLSHKCFVIPAKAGIFEAAPLKCAILLQFIFSSTLAGNQPFCKEVTNIFDDTIFIGVIGTKV